MAKADAVEAVQKLVAAFPTATVPEATLVLYAEKLADIPPELLAATVDRLIESSRFLPTISELRQCAARLAGLLPPTEAEALAIVRRADVSRPVYRRDGSYAYTEREWDWSHVEPETRELIRDVLEKVGEPCDNAGEAHFGWENGFQKTYAIAAQEVAQLAISDLSLASLPGAERPEALPPHASETA